MPIVIDHVALSDILGPPTFDLEVSTIGLRWLRPLACPDGARRSAFVLKVSERLTLPGVAVGLAWTPLGGEIMFVEASRMEGDGQLTLTGQLGDVMKESAHLAISWLRTNAKRYQLTNGERAPPPCCFLSLACGLEPLPAAVGPQRPLLAGGGPLS